MLTKKQQYDVGDYIVFTEDVEKMERYCNYWFSDDWEAIERFKGYCGHKTKIISVLQDKYIFTPTPKYKYIVEDEAQYLIDDDIIMGIWDGDEKYTIPYRIYKPHTKVKCPHCGERYDADDVSEISEDDKLCPECRKRLFVTPYHRYAPAIQFYGGGNGEGDKLYLGVELEIDEGGEYDTTVQKIMPIMNTEGMFIYCSHDGSLNRGFEIITQPATLEYHKSIMPQYKTLFNQLIGMGYESHNTTTCGLHVHFNRNFFAKNETLYITRLLYLLEKFWDDIVIFSRRNQRSFDRYSKKPDTSSRQYIHEWNKSNDHDGHYYALNITNENTIEFRMFRGTLNLLSYQAILEFVDTIVRIVKKSSTAELQRLAFDDLLTPTALEYYKSRVAMKKYE